MTRSLLALGLAAGLAVAPAAQIDYGDALPLGADAFAAADGTETSLDEATGPAGLVVVFWANACPWTDRYTPRLSALVGTYVPAGVGFVLVNANDPAESPRDSADGAREWAAGSGLAVPYLLDPEGQISEALGATNAPHAFFFGPDGTLVYDGALDDSPASPDRVEMPYLELAMDQSIASLPIEVQRTQAFGCSIKRASE